LLFFVTLEQILFNPGHICSPGSLRILQVSRRCWGVFAAQRTNLVSQRSNVSSWSRIALSFSRSGSRSAHRVNARQYDPPPFVFRKPMQ